MGGLNKKIKYTFWTMFVATLAIAGFPPLAGFFSKDSILLSAFQQYGITPGPLLFQNSGALVWGLIASLYIGNVLLLILNLPMVGIWIKLLEIPKPQLYGGIMLFAVLGVYSLHQSAVDVAIMIVVGLMGFTMQRYDFPVTPAIVGLILGPMAEQQFRRAMAISQGDITTFMTRPISGVIMWIVIAILLLPPLVNWYKSRKTSKL